MQLVGASTISFDIQRCLRMTIIIKEILQFSPNCEWKYNIDGIARDAFGFASCGGIFRGASLGWFALPIETAFVFHVEFIGAITAIEIVYSSGTNWLWFEIDS